MCIFYNLRNIHSDILIDVIKEYSNQIEQMCSVRQKVICAVFFKLF